MEFIYNKSDLFISGQVQEKYPDIIVNPLKWEIENNVIPNFGGTESDYATIETNLKRFHLENINGVVIAVEDGLTTEEQKQSILQELTKLDVEIPRIVEDLIKHTNFKPHKTKEDVISRKNLLRQQLQELEV